MTDMKVITEKEADAITEHVRLLAFLVMDQQRIRNND